MSRKKCKIKQAWIFCFLFFQNLLILSDAVTKHKRCAITDFLNQPPLRNQAIFSASPLLFDRQTKYSKWTASWGPHTKLHQSNNTNETHQSSAKNCFSSFNCFSGFEMRFGSLSGNKKRRFFHCCCRVNWRMVCVRQRIKFELMTTTTRPTWIIAN